MNEQLEADFRRLDRKHNIGLVVFWVIMVPGYIATVCGSLFGLYWVLDRYVGWVLEHCSVAANHVGRFCV